MCFCPHLIAPGPQSAHGAHRASMAPRKRRSRAHKTALRSMPITILSRVFAQNWPRFCALSLYYSRRCLAAMESDFLNLVTCESVPCASATRAPRHGFNRASLAGPPARVCQRFLFSFLDHRAAVQMPRWISTLPSRWLAAVSGRGRRWAGGVALAGVALGGRRLPSPPRATRDLPPPVRPPPAASRGAAAAVAPLGTADVAPSRTAALARFFFFFCIHCWRCGPRARWPARLCRPPCSPPPPPPAAASTLCRLLSAGGASEVGPPPESPPRPSPSGRLRRASPSPC